MDPTIEANLINRVRADGSDGRLAYDDLVREHQTWLVRYIMYLLGGRQGTAEDVAQEVLVKAYTHVHQFEGRSPLRGWLRTMATRMAFNQRRDAGTRRRYEEQVPEPPAPDPVDSLSAFDITHQVLDQLSYPYREALILRYVEELSVEECAQTLGVGLSAAKMRLKRARAAFTETHEEMVGHD